LEHWIEINLQAELRDQDRILLDELLPYARSLERKGTLVTFHYFREPEIRFRVRMKTARGKAKERKRIELIARKLVSQGLVSEWHFGEHGESGKEYEGEEDRYGKRGWKIAQEYFNRGAVAALGLLELKRSGKLENPLWARGLGNPWEGGDKNPWKEREDDPLVYHWSRYVHLFSNQLGFDIDAEAKLCSKQAERYRRISDEFGIKW
jgi:hypothetical protein